MTPENFNQKPIGTIAGLNKDIYLFSSGNKKNIDQNIVKSFGEEWSKFHDFDDQEIERLGKMYFDVLDDNIINKNTYVLDVGCGNQAIRKNIFELFKRRTLVTLKNIIIK